MEVFGWYCADTDLGRTNASGRPVKDFVVAAIGADERGSAVVWCRAQPWFYVDLERVTAAQVKRTLEAGNLYTPGAYRWKLVTRTPLNDNPWGEQRDHLQLLFDTQRTMGYAASLLRKKGVSICEADIPPVTRVFHKGVPSCGWIEQPEQRHDMVLTTASWETSVKDPECLKPCQDKEKSLIVTATWDVEVFSAESTPEDQRFPSAENEGDMVIQIVTFFSRSGEDAPYLAHATVIGVGDPEGYEAMMRKSIPPATRAVAEVWATEKELLESWIMTMSGQKAFVWQHFNGLGFDEGYIYRRARMLGVDMDPLSIIKGVEPTLVKSQMESNAYGHNEFETIEVPGVFHLDLMVSIKKDFKLTSYSLNACGEHFLKERKVDMSPQRLFDTFRANTPEGHLEILTYCMRDVSITYKLGHQLNFLTNMKEMARATMVPINFLITRGQQVKVQSLICNLTTKRGMVMRTWPKDHVHGEGKYKGATVLDPLRGAYFRPILTLDFASLYPSIMRAHNMSHDTLVREGAEIPEGVEIDWVDIPVGDSGLTKRVGFVQSPKGVCPELLESLALNRKAAKKEMAKHEKLAHEAEDPAQKTHHKFREAVFNAKQLAFKVSMNSVYGFLGVANGGKQPCIDISAAVTTFGRIYLERAATGAVQRAPEMTGHPVQVVYGDSVTGDTALVVRGPDGYPRTCRIDELVPEESWVIRGDGKEYAETDLDVWSDAGFTRVEKVIRHRTGKQLFRVMTHTGMVDCTEDHSLLDPSGKPLKPREVAPGTPLLHHDVSGIAGGRQTLATRAEALDLGVRLGSSPDYEYRNLHGEKVVPPHVLCAPLEIVEEFMVGYKMASKGEPLGKEANHGIFILSARLGRKEVSPTSPRGDSERRLRAYCSQAGPLVTINKINPLGTTDAYVYDLQTASHHFAVGPGELVVHNTDSIMVDAFKHLEPLDTKEKREEAVRKAFELGEWLAEHLTKLYKAPNNLEFEKVYMPYLLYEKKRYAGQMYSADLGPEKAKKVDYKGIQVVRTDTIGFVKRAISGVVNSIMTDMSTLKATKMAREAAIELLGGGAKLDYGEFVMSKKINSSYKVVCTWADPGFAGGEEKTTILVAPSGIWRPQKDSALESLVGSGAGGQGKKLRCEVVPGKDWRVLDYDGVPVGTVRMPHPHVHVALRKEARCPGSGEKAGDRVRYVFRSPERGEGGLQMETAEDPDYLEESGGSLDMSHYFENTFRSPMESLFELFYDNPFKVLFEDVKKRLAELQRQKLNKRKGQSELSAFFAPQPKKRL